MMSAFFFVLSLAATFAQRPSSKTNDRIESYQVGFITQKLNLSTEEAQKFWPLYNQYKEQTKKLRQDGKFAQLTEEMSDSEAEQFIKTALEREAKELELKKEFIQKLRPVLPARKIARLQDLEREFKRELLDMARERRMNR